MTSFPSLCLAAVVLAHLLIFPAYYSHNFLQNSVGGTKAASKDSSEQSPSSSEKLLVKDATRLFNSQSIPLRALQHARGGGQGLNMSGGMLAAASLTLGVGAPFALLMHGKDIEIRQGSSFTAFVDGDTSLEDIAFQTKDSPAVSTPSAQASPAQKSSEGSFKNNQTVAVSIASSPAGAEIEFDGNFVGNTPETLKVLSGDHLVVLRKHGFKSWERKLHVSGEIVNLTADLEPE